MHVYAGIALYVHLF